MAFKKEISEIFNLPVGEVFSKVHIVWTDVGVYIEGVKKILGISSDEVSVTTKEGEVKISGSELSICELGGNSLTVAGKVSNVQRIGGVK